MAVLSSFTFLISLFDNFVTLLLKIMRLCKSHPKETDEYTFPSYNKFQYNILTNLVYKFYNNNAQSQVPKLPFVLTMTTINIKPHLNLFMYESIYIVVQSWYLKYLKTLAYII